MSAEDTTQEHSIDSGLERRPTLDRGRSTPAQIEDALRRSEERYRSLYHRTPVMMHSIDHDGLLVSVNDYWLKVMGYEREEVLGRPITDFMTEASRQYAETVSIPLLRRTGDATDIEYQWVRKNGEIVDVLLSAKAEFDSQGNIDYSLAFILDVTEKKRAEEALRRSEARFRTLVENATDGFFLVGSEGEVLDVNDSACQMLGYDRGELLNLSVPDFSSESRIRFEKIRDQLEPGVPFALDTSLHRKDGSALSVEIRIGLYLDEGRRLFVCLARDISERKRVEEELRKARDELELRVGDLESFSYSISHDLRAPLRAIDGFSRILEEDHAARLDDECLRLLGIIRSNARGMGELIDDLLSFYRLARREMLLTDIDMDQLARSVVQDLRSITPNRDFEAELQPAPPARGDRAMIRQVLINLFSNAIKFSQSRKQSVIEFGFDKDENNGFYFVKDNGVGFEMKYAHKLFGVFQRLHSQAEFEGTGVGLATVEKIVHRHGGQVWAAAKPDRGATFYFTLPKSESTDG